ncbi:MAG: hypothetical protein LUG46_06510 [Erysipelotrichaceae bacterium]|nr:hypothetical protein [Erysipelotrichaceae bacterium]
MEDYNEIISISDINIEFQSEMRLMFPLEIECFQVENQHSNINIKIFFTSGLPLIKGQVIGNDGMFCFYDDGEYCYEKGIEGTDGAISLVQYTSNFKYCTLYIDEKTFPNVVQSVTKVLQLLPMRQLLTYYKVLMLHSSRIKIKDKAILFTAPSQTGKTTQSKLWCQYEEAQIVSNDRSLIRKLDNTYYTYGYPVDGSEPIYSNERIQLGAIVVLRQGKNNEIERLSIQMALKYLMEQTAYDNWNHEERSKIMQLWLNILEVCPVYMLRCTPDINAIKCLKEQLVEDGVLSNG